MNQMFKKVSSVCAALVCAASLTVSGTSFVMAAELDDAVETQLIMIAEGLTDAIIPLSDEEIESYLEGGDEFTVNAMNAWNDVKDKVGELKETGETQVEVSGDQYTATVPVEFEKEDAEFVYVFDDLSTMAPSSVSVNIQYSLATTLKNAALNTVMGLGTVFVVLAVLIFLISLFKYIPGSAAAKKKEEPAAAPAKAPAPAPVPVQTPAYDDKELAAVIAAAIAASEGTSPDGFVVRSIRKINRKRR